VQRCALWLQRELELLKHVRVVLALGGLAFAQLLRVLPEHGVQLPRAQFGHGVQVRPLGAGPLLIGSYHPSRQNTQTGRLTPAMLEDVLRAARLAAQA
jgi:uracil-DNA glycosylase